ncbi:hypothetical protein [Flexithrix dorotheae]|uniref:hypothetical protein n=1 Tax=Flexithrix dorotheae TaxID=70993 RepID=UPI00039A9612|nr:hypothetical protein [Flexithrix dorotheae]
MLTSKWQPTSAEMVTTDFKREMTLLIEHIKKFKAQYLLTLTNEMQFTISPELQEWVIGNIIPELQKTGLKKQAMIVPHEFFAKLSVEQTIHDINSTKRPITKIFSHKEGAMEWLYN